MKRILTLLTVCLLVAGTVQAKQPPKADTHRQAEQTTTLLNSGDYFALDRLTPEAYDSLPEVLKLQVDAVLGSRFNDLPRSCTAIETLLNKHGNHLDGPTQSTLFGMLLGNLRMMSEYGQAAGVAAMLQGGVAEDDEASKTTLDGMVRWFGALAQYPKTSISRPEGEVTLPLYIVRDEIRDALGSPKTIETLFTEVTIGDTTERFIFDTGCSQASFVSEDFAKRHGIRIICDSILVSGSAVNAYAKAGVLDSMRIGPVTVYNPTFMIAPPNEAIDTLYKIPPVLGTDFMSLAGELRLYPRRGQMIMPATESPLPESGRNLSLDTGSGGYTILMTCDGEPVTMKFDTGAVNTAMGENWFEKHKERVLAEGEPKEIGIGGFGGISRGHGYRMPSLGFGLNARKCILSNVDIYSDVLSIMSKEDVDGWLGVDFILQFDEVIINLPRMFVTVEQPADRQRAVAAFYSPVVAPTR